ncbi:MAG: hypothetical protein J6P28_10735 [Treponema sp.]|nr:hypothetical protein [Treponema sp.]
MQLGLKREMVFVEPHNPEWEDFAKEIIKELKEMLSDVEWTYSMLAAPQ